MASAVSISSDTFSPSQGPNVKSYMLMLRVTVTMATGNTNGSSAASSTSEISNCDNDGEYFIIYILFFALLQNIQKVDASLCYE